MAEARRLAAEWGVDVFRFTAVGIDPSSDEQFEKWLPADERYSMYDYRTRQEKHKRSRVDAHGCTGRGDQLGRKRIAPAATITRISEAISGSWVRGRVFRCLEQRILRLLEEVDEPGASGRLAADEFPDGRKHLLALPGGSNPRMTDRRGGGIDESPGHYPGLQRRGEPAGRSPGDVGLRGGVDCLVINDGSRDRTAETARAAGAGVVSPSRQLGGPAPRQTGFRYAVRRGYDVVIQIDADGPARSAGCSCAPSGPRG